MTQKTITIFYSWQSDLPQKTNASLIRNALHQAKDQLEEENPDINIIIDEATRNECGSPDIIKTILRKIDNCDFYIADVSIINNNDNATKKTPNPNVLFECGYALNALGWKRVTLLFNNHFGELTNLPFDLDRRRIATYNANSESTNKDLANNKIYILVYNILLSWIREIDILDPIIRKKDDELIKNQRDVESLKKFFSCFDVNSIKKLCEELPDYINSDVHFDYTDNLTRQVFSPIFKIHHKELYNLIYEFTELYSLIFSLSIAAYYKSTGKYNNKFIFKKPNNLDMPLPDNLKQAYKDIDEISEILYKKLCEIISIVQNTDQFIEVNIEELGNQALNRYEETERKIRQNMDTAQY